MCVPVVVTVVVTSLIPRLLVAREVGTSGLHRRAVDSGSGRHRGRRSIIQGEATQTLANVLDWRKEEEERRRRKKGKEQKKEGLINEG